MIKTLLPSPITALQDKRIATAGVNVFVKRDDLIHPAISGNKWRKLKYNIKAALSQNKKAILTFGGAFSNHIYATAAAGLANGIPTIGFIRGEELQPDNPTLIYAQNAGMTLHFVTRSEFKEKAGLVKKYYPEANDLYILPEGGTNELAIKGCEEIVFETKKQLQIPIDYWCTACGTGGTISGIIKALAGENKVIGCSALKGDFLIKTVNNLFQNGKKKSNWEINTDYHFGGYARFNKDLIEFINDFKTQHSIPLDPIYTGKLFYAIFDLMAKGYFEKGSTIVLVHTGGLQGIHGFNERYGGLIL